MNKRYHHGDLRNALIVAAAELIEESGAPDFAISDAAKRAGVSAAAPYRHFKDRDDLLDAVSDLCFIGLAETAANTRDSHPAGSRDGIIALGKTYLNYVSKHSAFYNLMWCEDKHSLEEPAIESGQRPGFYTFVGAVQDWCERQGLAGCDPLDLAVKLWAMAHGLAVLKINGQIDVFLPTADVENMLASSANSFLDGIEQHHEAV
ncbi:MAG: TetR/AcrR family transcriptional regulator [Halioglobus sp.]